MEIKNKREMLISMLAYSTAIISTLLTAVVAGKLLILISNIMRIPDHLFTNKLMFASWLTIIFMVALISVGVFAMKKYYNIGYFFFVKCQE